MRRQRRSLYRRFDVTGVHWSNHSSLRVTCTPESKTQLMPSHVCILTQFPSQEKFDKKKLKTHNLISSRRLMTLMQTTIFNVIVRKLVHILCPRSLCLFYIAIHDTNMDKIFLEIQYQQIAKLRYLYLCLPRWCTHQAIHTP